MEFVDRKIEKNCVVINYSFGIVKVYYDSNNKFDKAVRLYDKNNNYITTLTSDNVSDYNVICIISGVESLAKEAINDYLCRLKNEVESIDELIK